MKEMEKESVYKGKLPEGCKHCAKGSKMVLLVTGECEGRCWYCPLSEKKKDKPVVYADEKKVSYKEEILEEARAISASGTGITGGDPLLTEDTLEFIKLLKDEFGEEHHIHLYTQSIDLEHIIELEEAGLDEIRFHPPVERWEQIEETIFPSLLSDLEDETNLAVGIEIPSIPGKEEETVHLIEELASLLKFVNINELEFSSTNTEQLQNRGYEHKSDISSAVKGSEELALKLLDMDFDVDLHYCSLAFKDGVQLTNRIKRRAENVARESDVVTEEGTLIRGVIETEDSEKLCQELRDEYDIEEDMVWYDERDDCVVCSLAFLEEICPTIDGKCFGVEIYPTSDRLEVERWPLK